MRVKLCSLSYLQYHFRGVGKLARKGKGLFFSADFPAKDAMRS